MSILAPLADPDSTRACARARAIVRLRSALFVGSFFRASCVSRLPSSSAARIKQNS